MRKKNTEKKNGIYKNLVAHIMQILQGNYIILIDYSSCNDPNVNTFSCEAILYLLFTCALVI